MKTRINTKQIIIALSFLFLLNGCAFFKYGSGAKTIISNNYQYSQNQRIIVMPFIVSGKEQAEYEQGVADKFSLKIMELGLFTVIDLGLINKIKPKKRKKFFRSF